MIAHGTQPTFGRADDQTLDDAAEIAALRLADSIAGALCDPILVDAMMRADGIDFAALKSLLLRVASRLRFGSPQTC
jgi:hypothetical protein